MTESNQTVLLPVVDYLCVPEQQTPYLQGLRCSQCHAVFIDERKHCAKCGARNSLQAAKLADRGTLVAFTVVERSYPGIPVPFVSAIVDLDGGGTVKSNLVALDATQRKSLKAGMKVALAFEQAPWGDEKGRKYMLFNFRLLDSKSQEPRT